MKRLSNKKKFLIIIFLLLVVIGSFVYYKSSFEAGILILTIAIPYSIIRMIVDKVWKDN